MHDGALGWLVAGQLLARFSKSEQHVTRQRPAAYVQHPTRAGESVVGSSARPTREAHMVLDAGEPLELATHCPGWGPECAWPGQLPAARVADPGESAVAGEDFVAEACGSDAAASCTAGLHSSHWLLPPALLLLWAVALESMSARWQS